MLNAVDQGWPTCLLLSLTLDLEIRDRRNVSADNGMLMAQLTV